MFSGPMVRALLEGRKTMTRRLAWAPASEDFLEHARACAPPGSTIETKRPTRWQSVQPGDRLWVRESGIELGNAVDEQRDRDGYQSCGYRYAADGQHVYLPGMVEAHDHERSRNAIHMPRWASRLTLIVEAARMEPLHNITKADAISEGMAMPWLLPCGALSSDPRQDFADLWGTLHGPEAWDANPEVVVVAFSVVLQNIDRQENHDD